MHSKIDSTLINRNASFSQFWDFTVPSEKVRTKLLTVCGLATTGHWSGYLGEHFIAWAPMEASEAQIYNSKLN